MTENKLIRDMIAASPDRRNFVRKLGLAGAMATAAITSTSNHAYAQGAITDLDIAQFALNLGIWRQNFTLPPPPVKILLKWALAFQDPDPVAQPRAVRR